MKSWISGNKIQDRKQVAIPIHKTLDPIQNCREPWRYLGEDVELQVGAVDADGPAADLGAVEDEIVVLAAHVLRPRVEQLGVVRVWRRERVVRRLQRRDVLVTGQEQRKVDDPQKVQAAVAHRRALRLQQVGRGQPHLAHAGKLHSTIFAEKYGREQEKPDENQRTKLR